MTRSRLNAAWVAGSRIIARISWVLCSSALRAVRASSMICTTLSNRPSNIAVPMTAKNSLFDRRLFSFRCMQRSAFPLSLLLEIELLKFQLLKPVLNITPGKSKNLASKSTGRTIPCPGPDHIRARVSMNMNDRSWKWQMRLLVLLVALLPFPLQAASNDDAQESVESSVQPVPASRPPVSDKKARAEL